MQSAFFPAPVPQQQHQHPASDVSEQDASTICPVAGLLQPAVDAGSRSSLGSSRGMRFPSSRRYLWDKTPAGPQILITLQDNLPHVQVAASVFSSIACAAKQQAGSVPLQLRMSVTATTQVTALIQEFDPLGRHAAAAGEEPVQLTCLLSNEGLQDDVCSMRAALQAQLNQRDSALLQQLYVMAANATPAAGPAGHAALRLALLMPDAGLLATPLYAKRLCNTPLSQALLTPGQMAPWQSGYLSMDQARSLVPLLATDVNVYSTPLVGVWVKGPGSVLHPLVAVACLRFAYSSLLMDRAVGSQDGSFLVLLCPEGDLVSKCFEVCPAEPGSMQLALYTLQASTANNTSSLHHTGLLRAEWTPSTGQRLKPLPGPRSDSRGDDGSRNVAAGQGSRTPVSAGLHCLPGPGCTAADSPVLYQHHHRHNPRIKSATAGVLPATRYSAPSAVFGWRQPHEQQEQQQQQQQHIYAGIAARRSLPLTGQGLGAVGVAAPEYGAAMWLEPHRGTHTAPDTSAGAGQVGHSAASAAAQAYQQQQQQQWVHLGEQLLPEPLQQASDEQSKHSQQAPRAQPLPATTGAAAAAAANASSPDRSGCDSCSSPAGPDMHRQHPAMAPSTTAAAGGVNIPTSPDRQLHSSLRAAGAAAAPEAGGSSLSCAMHPVQQQQQQQCFEAADDDDDADSRPRLGSPVRPHRQPPTAAMQSPEIGPAAGGLAGPRVSRTPPEQPPHAALNISHAAGSLRASSGGWQMGEGPEPVSPSVRAGVALSNLALLQHLSSGQLQQALQTVELPEAHSRQQEQQSLLAAGHGAAAAAASVLSTAFHGQQAWHDKPLCRPRSSAAAGATDATRFSPSHSHAGAAGAGGGSYALPVKHDPQLMPGWRSPDAPRHLMGSSAGPGMAGLCYSPEAGLRTSTGASAALSAATAAVQRIPASPYARALGVQRYAADAAALHSTSRDLAKPGLSWGPAAAGLRTSLAAASPSELYAVSPTGALGRAGARYLSSSAGADEQQRLELEDRLQRSAAAAASTAGLLDAAEEVLHAYSSPSGSMMLQQLQLQQQQQQHVTACTHLKDPVAAALQQEVERLRQQLAQLQQQFKAAGMPSMQQLAKAVASVEDSAATSPEMQHRLQQQPPPPAPPPELPQQHQQQHHESHNDVASLVEREHAGGANLAVATHAGSSHAAASPSAAAAAAAAAEGSAVSTVNVDASPACHQPAAAAAATATTSSSSSSGDRAHVAASQTTGAGGAAAKPITEHRGSSAECSATSVPVSTAELPPSTAAAAGSVCTAAHSVAALATAAADSRALKQETTHQAAAPQGSPSLQQQQPRQTPEQHVAQVMSPASKRHRLRARNTDSSCSSSAADESEEGPEVASSPHRQQQQQLQVSQQVAGAAMAPVGSSPVRARPVAAGSVRSPPLKSPAGVSGPASCLLRASLEVPPWLRW